MNNRFFLLAAFCSLLMHSHAQQITGVWSGRINRKKAEIKFVQKGDSITGTSYYYESGKNYLRYSIKGYFDADNNSVVWWDDQLISDEGNNSKDVALLSVADFNCPGDGKMMLDGTATPKENQIKSGDLLLTKIVATSFPDEWDFVIDNYTEGTNDPDIIDSVALIASAPVKKKKQIEKPKETIEQTFGQSQIPTTEQPVAKTDAPSKIIQNNFIKREKVFNKEIPIEGDSIELRFYDNAEIDGDSISVFLNDKMLCTHIRLTDKPYTIKIAVKDLNESNELVMVAENLGAIPPNTSYMVLLVGDKRYDAQLASTENSSAMIRLKKTDAISSSK